MALQALKVSTASQVVMLGPFLDNVDGVTPETALSIANTDIKVNKHGSATFASKNSGGGTHVENGFYQATLDGTDTNTVGRLVVSVQKSGAIPVLHEFTVLPADVYDALINDSGVGIRADVQAWLGTAVAAVSVAGVPEVDVTHWLGAAAAAVGGLPSVHGAALGANVVNASALAADAVAEIQAGLATSAGLAAGLAALNDLSLADFFLADSGQVYTAAVPGSVIYETIQLVLKLANAVDGKTVQQAMRGWSAVLLGKSTGLDTGLPVYRDMADTADRVSATTDADGNRSAVTLNL